MPLADYQFHPVCVAFPEMDADTFAKRKCDYAAHPERAKDTSVLLAIDPADGVWKIADGRHHYRLCKEFGYECEVEKFVGTEDDLYDLAEARGLNRRHMDETQRAAVVIRFAEFRHGGDRKKKHDQDAPVHLDPPADGTKKLSTQKKAAKKAHVSVRTVASVSKAAKAEPALLDAMRDKKIDAKTAAKVADLPAADRKKIAGAADVKKAAKEALAKQQKKSLTKKTTKKQPTTAPIQGDKEQPATTPVSPPAIGSLPESEPPEPEPKPVKLTKPPTKDAWGIPVQDHAAESFAVVPKFRELLTLLKRVRDEITPLAETKGGKLLQRKCQFQRSDNKHGGRWVLAHLDNAIGALEDTTPRHTDCPYHFNTHQPHATGDVGKICPLCADLRVTGDLKRFQVPDALLSAMRAHYGLEDA